MVKPMVKAFSCQKRFNVAAMKPSCQLGKISNDIT